MLELASLRKAVAGLFIYCSKVRVFDMTFSAVPPVVVVGQGGCGGKGLYGILYVCACVCACVYLMRNNGGGVNNPGA